MYIFSRRTLAALGKQFEAVPAAVAVAEKVSEISGSEINVFTARFGAPLGSIMWSRRADSMAELQTFSDKVLADSGYLAMVDDMAGLFMTPAEDSIGRVLTTPFEGAPARFWSITQASMLAGKYAHAVEFGIEIADYMGAQLGAQAAFLKASYGGFADVTWLLGFDSMDDVDRAEDWQLTDAGYQERVTKAAELFVDGSGRQSLIEKVN